MTNGAEVLVDGLGSPEGPDLLPDGRIVFVETFLCRVSAWSPEQGLASYAYVGGAPTSCAVGRDGVYVAQNGRTAGPWMSPDPVAPSIQRIGVDGAVEEVLTEIDGRPLAGPNDLAFGAGGELYFTDPGTFDDAAPERGFVCCLEPDGSARVLVDAGLAYPNGVAVEADGSVVWTESFSRRVRRLRPGGAPEDVATLPDDRVPDGLAIAANGHLFVAGVTSGGIDVLSPDGEALEFIPSGPTPLNCVFTGTSLVITDFGESSEEADQGQAVMTGRLVRLEVGVAGLRAEAIR